MSGSATVVLPFFIRLLLSPFGGSCADDANSVASFDVRDNHKASRLGQADSHKPEFVIALLISDGQRQRVSKDRSCLLERHLVFREIRSSLVNIPFESETHSDARRRRDLAVGRSSTRTTRRRRQPTEPTSSKLANCSLSPLRMRNPALIAIPGVRSPKTTPSAAPPAAAQTATCRARCARGSTSGARRRRGSAFEASRRTGLRRSCACRTPRRTSCRRAPA